MSSTSRPSARIGRSVPGRSSSTTTEKPAAYGPVRVASRDRRRDALDRLIAAHALALDVTLVTNNVADFAGYPALRVENWVDET